MTYSDSTPTLPAYNELSSVLSTADFPFSLSQLHGLLCGYICIGESEQAMSFLHHLITSHQPAFDKSTKELLFSLFTISEHLITNLDFSFQLSLPDDATPLSDRAQAFSEWCQSFLQGMQSRLLAPHHFDEETEEVLFHLQKFAELDYEHLTVCEEDEIAFMEVYEYTRLAILRIRSQAFGDSKQAH